MLAFDDDPPISVLIKISLVLGVPILLFVIYMAVAAFYRWRQWKASQHNEWWQKPR